MKSPRVWVGIIVSIVAVGVLVMSVDPHELMLALSSANPLLVVISVATLPFLMYLKVIRWRLLFPRPERISNGGLSSALYLGYMVNTVLPLRAGEIVRAFLVRQTENVNISTSLATVLIEKVLDLGTVVLFLFILGFVMTLPETAQAASYLAGAGLLGAIVGLALVLAMRERFLRLSTWLESRIGVLAKMGVTDLLAAFLDGLSFARKPRVLALVLFWTLLQWALSVVTMYLVLVAFGITLPLTVAYFLLVTTNLGMVIPSAPGYVGVFHAIVVGTLILFGISQELALAAAIVMHAEIFGVFILGGAYYLVRGGAATFGGGRLGDLVTRAQSAANEAH
ncbi:MAG: flippase-like domain-containing protein [Chloroflexi bacterium]|nr:flippase-like domain-containing protein [Chloroflexota bacterium]